MYWYNVQINNLKSAVFYSPSPDPTQFKPLVFFKPSEVEGRGDMHPASTLHKYSVTQSYATSFCRDVVFNSFNSVYRDENSILDQTYQSKYVRIFI